METNRKLTFIDLFAGAGGLSEGFIRAGFSPLAHIEMDTYACNTLKTRTAYHYLKSIGKLSIYEKYLREKQEKEDGSKLWSQVPQDIINTVIQATIGEKTISDIFSKIDNLIKHSSVDIIIGGPPCQAYSVAGRARMGKAAEQDPRNELYKFYVRFLAHYRPKMFVFENVLGIRSAKKGKPFLDLQRLVRELGYEIEWKVQIASQHGVLQNRQRVIIIGWQTKDENNKQTDFHYPDLKPEINTYQVLKDLFSDLPERKAGEGKLCEPITYTKSLSEMPYLQKANIRTTFNFTTQHIARPHNENDREIYKMAIETQLF